MKNFAFKLGTSKEGANLAHAATALSYVGVATDIIDLSQGHPCRRPVDQVKWQIVRSLEYVNLERYESEIVPPAFKIATLRYFIKQGMNIDDVLKSSLGASFEEKSFRIAELHQLLEDGATKGKILFESNQESQKKILRLSSLIDEFGLVGGTDNSRKAVYTGIKMFKGKYVLTPSGCYHSFSEIPALLGKEWEILPTNADNNYKLDAVAMDKWFDHNPNKAKEVCCFLLIDPGNPSGAIYSAKEKADLAAVCRKHAIPVIEDMIYSGIVVKPDMSHVPFVNMYPENTLEISGMGKAFGGPKLRLSTISGTPALVRHFNAHTRIMTGFLNTISCVAAAAAMELTPHEYFVQNNTIYQERFEVAQKAISAANDKIQTTFNLEHPFIISNDPDGGFFLLMRMPSLKGKFYECYNDQNEKTVHRIDTSIDLTKMFLHGIEAVAGKRVVVQGVRAAPTSSTGIPPDALEVRLSMGDVDKERIVQAIERMTEIIIHTLDRQTEYRINHAKERGGGKGLSIQSRL